MVSQLGESCCLCALGYVVGYQVHDKHCLQQCQTSTLLLDLVILFSEDRFSVEVFSMIAVTIRSLVHLLALLTRLRTY